MDPTQQWILFAIGCVCMVVGASLMAWSAVQRQSVAGVSAKDVSDVLKAAAGLVDAFARYFPNAAARVGIALVILGGLLIFVPYFIPAPAAS